MAAEKENFCYCPGIPEIIVPELRQFDGEYWNVFCSSNNLQLTLNVFAYGEKYIYTKPKNCYYGIYVIWVIRIHQSITISQQYIFIYWLSMKRFLLLCLSHFAVLSFVIGGRATSDSNLGFRNETGSNTTQAQVISFINFINSASAFYRFDTAARLNYISDQMNASFGQPGLGFTIIQHGNHSNNIGWGTKNSIPVFASVASGVDKIWP